MIHLTNALKKIVEFTVIDFYARLINLWLFIIKKFFKYEFIYPEYISFGDTYVFYLYKYYELIKDSNKKVIIFGNSDSKVIKLLFEKEKYFINIFYIFSFMPEHLIHSKLHQMSNFSPTKCSYLRLKNRDSIKKLINVHFQRKKIISKNLLNYKNYSYFTFFIKFYNENKNDLSGSADRQTTNLKKVYDFLSFILQNNFKVVIIGNNNDKSVELIKKFDFKNYNENISFFRDLSEDYSIYDQLFIVNHSKGYIGSGCAFAELVYYQKKKSIIFDIPLNSYPDQMHPEYRKFLYKYIKINKKTHFLDTKLVEEINENKKIFGQDNYYDVIENNYEEICQSFKKHFEIDDN